MNAIFLCAGFGTRLYPLTRDRPKPLLPVAGKPIVEYLLDQLEATQAIDSFVVVSNDRFFEAFATWGRSRVQVLNDGARANENRLGATADLALAVRSAASIETTIVAAGDNLYRMSFDAFFEDYRSRPRNLTLRYREPDPVKLARTGVAEIDGEGRLLRLTEKPSEPASQWACPAFYLLEADALARIEAFVNEHPASDAIGSFIAWLCERVPIYTHEMRGARLDIGDRRGYDAAAGWLEDSSAEPLA